MAGRLYDKYHNLVSPRITSIAEVSNVTSQRDVYKKYQPWLFGVIWKTHCFVNFIRFACIIIMFVCILVEI